MADQDYDWTTHGDFKKWYDPHLKRNYWTLGYFGGGAVNIVDAHKLANQYVASTGVDINTVVIDEINKSRRYLYFKVIYSTQEQEQEKDAYVCKNGVWQWLTD